MNWQGDIKMNNLVNINTDIVIVGNNPGSKYDKALKLNRIIWDEEKTLQVLNNLPNA